MPRNGVRVGVRIRTLKTTELSRRGGFLLLSFFVLTARKDLGTITSDRRAIFDTWLSPALNMTDIQ